MFVTCNCHGNLSAYYSTSSFFFIGIVPGAVRLRLEHNFFVPIIDELAIISARTYPLLSPSCLIPTACLPPPTSDYEKHTKEDVLPSARGPAPACDSPTPILTVLHQQVREFDQSQSSNEALSKWLDPTVNVLYALSGTLGEGVGLVCMKMRT